VFLEWCAQKAKERSRGVDGNQIDKMMAEDNLKIEIKNEKGDWINDNLHQDY
jgi:hypothetical protein